jgi:hypothetical protein
MHQVHLCSAKYSTALCPCALLPFGGNIWQHRSALSHDVLISLSLPDLWLSETSSRAYLVIKLSSRHEIQNENDTIFLLIHLVHIHDAWMVQTHQHLQLVLGLHQTGFINFSRKGLSSISSDDFPDSGLRPICVGCFVRPRIYFN